MELREIREQKKMQSPLVSIIIITYNSSSFVLELLESTKAQTYQNIELIVSDDCSIDNTVDICNKWITKNGKRFIRTELVQVNRNTGISANCNRGIHASKGTWIKVIAGDDALYPNAIEEYLKFTKDFCQEICCAKLEIFGQNQTLVENNKKAYDHFFSLMELPLKKQQKLIRKQLYIPAPGLFYSKKLYDIVGGFDERFPMGEEWPFFLKIFEKGYKISLLNKRLVKYRVSNISACRGNEFGLNKRVFDSTKDFFFKVRIRVLLNNFMFYTAWSQTLYYIYIAKNYEKKGKFELYFFKCIFLLDPKKVFLKLTRYTKRYFFSHQIFKSNN